MDILRRKIILVFSMVLLMNFMGDVECVKQKSKIYFDRKGASTARRPKLSFLQFMAPLAVADNCKSASGMAGTCLSVQDCLKRGGRGLETCAWGLGVCCVHTASCGDESSANTTYLINPNYPNVWTNNIEVCTYSVKPRLFAKICQLRLDFDEFYIKGPESGVCSTDMFVASGQDLNSIAPVICGQNTGQHMYLQVGSSSGPYRFTITTKGESLERKWKIRVTQIPCSSKAMAPPHCLQYFTGSVGSFQSFNYGNVKPLEKTYFQNLNYAICIRKEAAMCGAIFKHEDFNVNIAKTTAEGCFQDYLSFGADRKCGTAGAIKDGVTLANSGPMVITFVSDSETTVGDSGFSFKYSQFSCSSRY